VRIKSSIALFRSGTKEFKLKLIRKLLMWIRLKLWPFIKEASSRAEQRRNDPRIIQ
jgi:hypothetical protein